MTRSRFQNIFGVYLVLLHFITILIAFFRFSPDGASGSKWLTGTLVVLVPLFATFTTAVLNFIFTDHPKNLENENNARVFISFLITTAFAIVLNYIIIKESIQLTMTLEEYTATLGIVETAFGIYIGFIVKKIFESSKS